MKAAILKIVLLIFMFLLPISVSVGLIRKDAGKSVFVPTSAYVNYLAEYPDKHIEDLQLTITRLKEAWNSIVDYKEPEGKPEPEIDINNGVVDYIFGTNFGDYAVNWIVNLYEGVNKIMLLCLRFNYDCLMILFDSLGWALGFIPYIIRY